MPLFVVIILFGFVGNQTITTFCFGDKREILCCSNNFAIPLLSQLLYASSLGDLTESEWNGTTRNKESVPIPTLAVLSMSGCVQVAGKCVPSLKYANTQCT